MSECCQHEPGARRGPARLIFKVQGLDCAEEVSALKRAVGPLVRGEDNLAFDVLKGRMTVLEGAGTVLPDAIRRAVANVMSNALRHGHKVEAVARRADDWIEITVDDDGPGVPPESREDVFRPFYRLDQSRNPETGGVGLGLAIVRDILRGHGGDATMEGSPLGGARARLRLPV